MTLLMSLGNTNLTLGIAAGETIEQARIPIGGFTDLPKTLALLAPFLAHRPPPAACAISWRTVRPPPPAPFPLSCRKRPPCSRRRCWRSPA
jgi:hypothetical protein